MKLKNLEKILPFLIVFLAIFLRAWRSDKLFPFTMDEEYQAFLARNIIEGKHFPLIGVNVADTGLYLGPFFTYLSAFSYFLFGVSPVGGILFSALFGGLTVYFLIKIGKTINKSVGLLAGLLYSVSFLANAYDRKFWNPSLVPLSVTLLVLALLKVKKDLRWWLVILAVFGLAFHVHYSIFALLPLTIYYLCKNKIKVNNRWFKFSLVIFIFCLLPLTIFDLRHNFTNVRALTRLDTITRQSNQQFNLVSKTRLFINTLDRIIYVPGQHDLAKEIVSCPSAVRTFPSYPIGIVIILGVILLIFSTKSNQEKQLSLILSGGFLSFGIFSLVYLGEISEYYFLALMPLAFLVLAWGFENLVAKVPWWVKIFCGGMLLVMVLYNTISVMRMTNSFGLAAKRQMINWVAGQVGNDPYTLDSVGACYKFEGYRYLFTAFFKPPIASYVDPYFAWLYPDVKDTSLSSQKNVVIWNSLNDTGVKESKEWDQWLTMAAKERIIANFRAMKVLVK